MDKNINEENTKDEFEEKPVIRYKTCHIKQQNNQLKCSKIDVRPIRSYSTRFPNKFVPRLHPKKSNVTPSPLKLNNNTNYTNKKNKKKNNKQLSDDEVSSSDILSSSSSSSSSDLENLELKYYQQQQINETNNKTKDNSNEISQEKIDEEGNGELLLRKKSSVKFNNVIDVSIKEFENEDKDLSDEENNLKINEINKNKENIISTINDISPIINYKFNYRNRFSSDICDYGENENRSRKNSENQPLEFEGNRSRVNSIKILRKRMTRIKAKTMEIRNKEAIDIIHKNLKKSYNFEKLSNENLEKIDKKDNNNQEDSKNNEIFGRKRSCSILEMLSIFKKLKKVNNL